MAIAEAIEDIATFNDSSYINLFRSNFCFGDVNGRRQQEEKFTS